jgi:hypothetical protein
MHDLLRAYATSLTIADDSAQEARASLDRLFDYYLATAAAAMNTLYPAETHYRPRIPPAGTPTPALTDPDTALAWPDTERPNLSLSPPTPTCTAGPATPPDCPALCSATSLADTTSKP